MLKSKYYLPYFEMLITTKTLSIPKQEMVKEYLKEVAEDCNSRVIKLLDKEKELDIKISKYPSYLLNLPDIKKIVDRLEKEKLKHASTISFFSDLLVEVSTFTEFSNIDKIVKLSCFRDLGE